MQQIRIRYRDVAVQLCLMLPNVYCLPLRQTQGFIKPLFKQRGMNMRVSDYTTIGRRSDKVRVSLSATSQGN